MVDELRVKGGKVMQTLQLDRTAISYSPDGMTAYLRLPEPAAGVKYSLEDVEAALVAGGVKQGIDQRAILNMIRSRIYDRSVAVATGKAPQDGIDGYFEYMFQSQLDGKPRINEDGSVSYAIKLFEMVTEGQVIAKYHPAVPGVDGYTVKDTPIRARPGREMPPLRGRGFSCKEDGVTYIASITGKIDKINDKINILPVFEASGDVDANTGNIEFRGDVIIHGSVDDIEIRATGTVTVDGVVQGASIFANKDIVVAGGVLGNGKSVIDAKGKISAKFFEFATVRSKGDITADIFLNSNVYCEGSAFVMSKKGCIVGGSVHAVSGIEANSIGNNAEIRTHVLVGNGGEVRMKMEELRNSIKAAEANINKSEMILQKFQEYEEKTGQSCKDDPRRVQLVRIRVRDLARKAADEEDLKKLRLMVESAKGANIKVRKRVFPGVFVSIDSCDTSCKDTFDDIIFIKQQEKVVMRRLSDWGDA